MKPYHHAGRRIVAGLWAALALAVMLVGGAALAQDGRATLALNTDWRFYKGDTVDGPVTGFAAKDWLKVTLPHTYNAADGADGGGYYRGAGWYRRELVLPDAPLSGRYVLQFDGAALVAEVYVNGRRIGRHEGGYAAFRFDATEALRPGGNLLAVRVDNSPHPVVAPLGGDFTIFGGLYRGVSLIHTPDLHIDTLDYGGPGVYARAVAITADQAEVEVVTRVRDAGATSRGARIETRILAADGTEVARGQVDLAAVGREATPVRQILRIARPRLWRGVADPYLYTVESQVVAAGGAGRDLVRQPLGLRTIGFDPKAGFRLNGEPLTLRGVNLHLDRPGVGLAVSAEDMAEDVRIMQAMGANALRLVHFQHPQPVYDLADAAGLVLWTEIPFNSKVGYDPAFQVNIQQQLRELIRQNYNHPSVVLWGLGNEVYAADAVTNQTLAALQTLARAEDPSRPTAYAHCCQSDTDPLTLHTDVIGYNRYFGWYRGEGDALGGWADETHRQSPDRAILVSEYGAGGSILHQQDPPKRPETTAGFHPEHYQVLTHEQSWRAIRDRAFLGGSFIWVAFDFASDDRNEGDRPGINDKGLVSHDRRTPKDAYAWYQANWSEAPMAYITHRRHALRTTQQVDLKVYSNLPSLTLSVNGRIVGTAPVVDHVALWPGVVLRPGVNQIRVSGRRGLARVTDAVEWVYAPETARVLAPGAR
ncbi:glycoside hydrolase family 2 protein [Caulobacter sp. SL161]|uniref:glycoside hydrolase family 2 protein n=1 Tax=Caulobacter sp. SL161 TaxID=2995156 RepID=UPI002274ED76|nr:glycoside hydrolase family 2 TIM barrel-domain containing protein [Caulobacter sp. SL161]MCY1646872.1 glycoside hydrolase family 2 protein [Caulobacter sp. SL161]